MDIWAYDSKNVSFSYIAFRTDCCSPWIKWHKVFRNFQAQKFQNVQKHFLLVTPWSMVWNPYDTGNPLHGVWSCSGHSQAHSVHVFWVFLGERLAASQPESQQVQVQFTAVSVTLSSLNPQKLDLMNWWLTRLGGRILGDLHLMLLGVLRRRMQCAYALDSTIVRCHRMNRAIEGRHQRAWSKTTRHRLLSRSICSNKIHACKK